jgi:PIN domain nuclease of toxin-antitoxin system
MGYRVIRVLLDTHALVWWVEGRENLSAKAREAIEDADTVVLVSAASAWELAIKSRLGKFKSRELAHGLDEQIQEEGFVALPISIEHALRAGALDLPHKDPFDRMLIAQAQIEDVSVISKDKAFDNFAVRRLW